MSIRVSRRTGTMNFELISKVKKSKPFTVLDGVIVAVIIAFIAVSAWLIFRVKPSAVHITAPGYEREFALTDDRTVELEHLTVVISGGYVWVENSDCRDKTCEHTGKINRAGQSIVCLPNGVVVSITGQSDLQWGLG